MNILLACHLPEYVYIKKYLEKIKDSHYELNEQEFIEDLTILFNYQTQEKLKRKQSLRGLEYFLNSLNQTVKHELLNHIIPYVASLALETAEIWPSEGPKYMQAHQQTSQCLTKHQVSVLIANMVLLIIPNRRHKQNPRSCERQTIEDWYTSSPLEKDMQSKLWCLHAYLQTIYLNRTNDQFKNLIVEFERITFDPSNLLKSESDKFGEIEILQDFKIEDYEGESIKIDFANKSIGGGVLYDGNVQEEIMFCLNPEMLVSIIFSEIMKDGEAIHISGYSKVSNSSGYGSSFKFESLTDQSQLKIDEIKRKVKTHTSCIDAIYFQNDAEIRSQYQEDQINRELRKCFAGFVGGNSSRDDLTIPIVTGNWGCGIFNGDVHLKLLIQWIAASVLKRKLIYMTFNHDKFQNYFEFILSLKGKEIKSILEVIKKFSTEKDQDDLYKFMKLNL